MITKVLASIMLPRLTPVREQQDGVHPGQGCIAQALPFDSYIKRATHRSTTIGVFLLEEWLHFSRPKLLFNDLQWTSKPEFIDFLPVLYSHVYVRVSVHSESAGDG